MPKFPNPAGYAGRKGNKDRSGSARFATNAEAVTGTADDLIVSPVSLAGAVDDLMPDASTILAGKVLLNTDGTLAGADNTTVPTALAAKTYIDNVAISGSPDASESVKGIAEICTVTEAIAVTDDTRMVTPSKIGSIFEAPPALGSGTPAAGSFTTLATSGLASLSASATILTAGAPLNLGSDNSGDAVNLGLGNVARSVNIGSSAAAHVVTIGSVTGASQVILNSGTAGIQMASTGAGDITINSDDTLLLDADGVLELNSSGGVIGIGNDADAQNINIGTGAAARTITVGNGTGATSIVLDCGTGALNLGTNAVAHSVSIGNSTGASAVSIEVGTGNFDVDGVGASTYTIGASTTSGEIKIGGTAQTGTLSIGDSSGVMTLEIGAGEGATAISIGDGGTAANAITIGTGAVANTVAVGSASAGAITIDTAAGISLDAATASNFTVSGAADLTLDSSAGSVNISGGEAAADAISIQAGAGGVDLDGALQVNIASSQNAADAVFINASAGGIDITASNAAAGEDIDIQATGSSVNILSTEAVNDAIVISASDAAGGIQLDAGTGKVYVTGASFALTSAATQLQVEGGAVTDFIGQSTLTAGTVTVLNTNIAATDRVFVTRSDVNGSTALGVLDVSITAATSFVIDARNPADATVQTNDVSVVDWFIVRQL